MTSSGLARPSVAFREKFAFRDRQRHLGAMRRGMAVSTTWYFVIPCTTASAYYRAAQPNGAAGPARERIEACRDSPSFAVLHLPQSSLDARERGTRPGGKDAERPRDVSLRSLARFPRSLPPRRRARRTIRAK